MSNFMGVGIFWIGLNRPDLGCWRLTLRSRVWIVVRPTENDSTRLYKNDDISIVMSCSKLRFGR